LPDILLHNERELLLRTAEGDEKAFAVFFEQTSSLIKNWVIKLIKNEAASIEVIQDVYIQIWLYRDKLATVENIFSWLKTVTSHQCFKYLVRQKNYYQRFGAEVPLEPHQSFTEDQLNYKETRSVIDKTISNLTDQQQLIYRLSRHEGLNSGEIAERLNISRSHVRNSITVILSAVRNNLKKADRIYILTFLVNFMANNAP
jgi:RNA polymerase sigma factor (sigma-70 family)